MWNAWAAAPEAVFIAVSLVLAISGAVVASFTQALGRVALGAVAGISFSMWVFCFRPVTLLQTEWALNLVLSLITLACAFLTFYKEIPDDKYPVIISSSFSGAYAIICGMDIFLKVGIGQVFFAVIRGKFENLPQQA